MLGKIIRFLIILGLIASASRVGYRIYTQLMELLSFQISLYEQILQTQYALAQGEYELQGIWDQATAWWGNEQHATRLAPEHTIQEQLVALKQKMHVIALSLSTAVSIVIFKIVFDIAFSIKKTIQNLRSFVEEA